MRVQPRSQIQNSKKDFNYSILEDVASEVAAALGNSPESNPLIVVISTVLPGTMRDRVIPKLRKVRDEVRFCYNPYFIAMGTTIPDF